MQRRWLIALLVIGFVVVVGGALLLIGVLLGDDTDKGVKPSGHGQAWSACTALEA